jgi:hypothetical protein
MKTNFHKELEKLKAEIISALELLENTHWSNCVIELYFPPFTNKGFSSSPAFYGKENNPIDLVPKYNELFRKLFYGLIIKYNQESTYNQITFFTNKDDYDNSKIEISFNQEVEDEFQSNLPKSKRGKTIPWYVSEKLK